MHNQQSIPDDSQFRTFGTGTPENNYEITCTSLTASYSSASASLSIAVLVKMLLKSKEQR